MPAIPPMASAKPDEKKSGGKDTTRRSFAITAWLAAAFCGLVCIGVLKFQVADATRLPWTSPELTAMKEQLAREPGNEQLKEQIRAVDAQTRTHLQRRINLYRSAALLIGCGAVVMIVAGRAAMNSGRRLPLPPAERNAESAGALDFHRARQAVAATGVLAAIGFIALISMSKPELLVANSKSGAKLITSPAKPSTSLADFKKNFPRFRGWDGSGWMQETNSLLSWVGKPGAGLAWKTPVLAPGHSSPVIWSNTVFLTGGTAKLREVFAYDAGTGQLLWRTAITNVDGSVEQVPPIPEDTTYAASTGATDGRMFFAIFGNGDVAAVNFSGAVAWTKAFGPLKNAYGHATSLAVWPGILLVQLDQGENAGSNSRLIALDTASGRTLWEKPRALPSSWATPIVIEAAGKTQVVTLGVPSIIAYAANDGTELWRAQLLEGEVVPSPVLAGTNIIAPSPSARLLAIDPAGMGDVTKRAAVWTNLDNAPDITSPVSNGELVFTAGSGGELACMDAATGKTLWTHDLQTQVQSSPAIVGDHLFVIGMEGAAIVVEAARTFKEVAHGNLPDKFLSSPAFAGGATFLRGQTNLYCLRP